MRADTTTRPVRVPTLAGTVGPRVKGTARNALRSVKNQTLATSVDVRKAAAGEETS
jgi:hypothetical protein